MDKAYQIIGMLIGLIGALAVLALCVYSVIAILERRARRIRGHAQARSIREIGASMVMGAHWYYEGGIDGPALLVECIGEYMMKNGVYSEQYIRDLWRAKRKAATGGANAAE